MTATVFKEAITLEQIDFALCDIATTAKHLDRMISVLTCGGTDVLPDESILIGMLCMVQRIGWAADMVMERSAISVGPCYGGAENWMMPPLFHKERGAA